MSAVPSLIDPQKVARDAVALGLRLGADEVRASVGRADDVQLQRRGGRLERAQEARTFGLSVSLFVEGRYSSHSSSDMRPEAIAALMERGVESTRLLEPDPDRALPDRALMGGLDEASLDLDDPAARQRDPARRREELEALEARAIAAAPADLISTTAHLWEGRSESWMCLSNGFETQSARTTFGWGVEATLKEAETGKLPEGYAFEQAVHLSDRPSADALMAELDEALSLTRRTSACASGRYLMVLDARVVGRLLGALLGPMSGGALHERRSVFLGKLGEQVASPRFSLFDDPTIPRGLGSRSTDGDGLLPVRRALIDEGVLKTPLLDVYYARKLGMAPTTGGVSNLVVPIGDRSWRAATAAIPEAIRVTSFLGGNTNPASGDFSFGIRGQLLRHGEAVQNLSEMNITGNILDLYANFVEAADDVRLNSSTRSPSLLFDGVSFSGA
jgi:PmbA protein